MAIHAMGAGDVTVTAGQEEALLQPHVATFRWFLGQTVWAVELWSESQ